MSNLAEGDYTLGVHYLGLNDFYCACGSADVRVVLLAAISPRIIPANNLAFDVVTLRIENGWYEART
ncbi:MAG TPA: hypothetical protein VL361_04785 [Candidatus Limnocylindrales bacterium]|nr:hypothetical protein [Candidatus Limnocylindrales bacterium]